MPEPTYPTKREFKQLHSYVLGALQSACLLTANKEKKRAARYNAALVIKHGLDGEAPRSDAAVERMSRDVRIRLRDFESQTLAVLKSLILRD